MSAKPEFVYETYIRAPAERVWEALTTPEFTRRYFHATDIESTWQPGEPVYYHSSNGNVAVEGEVLEVVPGARLAITWHVLYDDEAAKETPTRVIFELEQLSEQTRLRVTHDRFPEGSVVLAPITSGWPWIIASLKSLLETGKPLPAAA